MEDESSGSSGDENDAYQRLMHQIEVIKLQQQQPSVRKNMFFRPGDDFKLNLRKSLISNVPKAPSLLVASTPMHHIPTNFCKTIGTGDGFSPIPNDSENRRLENFGSPIVIESSQSIKNSLRSENPKVLEKELPSKKKQTFDQSKKVGESSKMDTNTSYRFVAQQKKLARTPFRRVDVDSSTETSSISSSGTDIVEAFDRSNNLQLLEPNQAKLESYLTSVGYFDKYVTGPWRAPSAGSNLNKDDVSLQTSGSENRNVISIEKSDDSSFLSKPPKQRRTFVNRKKSVVAKTTRRSRPSFGRRISNKTLKKLPKRENSDKIHLSERKQNKPLESCEMAIQTSIEKENNRRLHKNEFLNAVQLSPRPPTKSGTTSKPLNANERTKCEIAVQTDFEQFPSYIESSRFQARQEPIPCSTSFKTPTLKKPTRQKLDFDESCLQKNISNRDVQTGSEIKREKEQRTIQKSADKQKQQITHNYSLRNRGLDQIDSGSDSGYGKSIPDSKTSNLKILQNIELVSAPLIKSRISERSLGNSSAQVEMSQKEKSMFELKQSNSLKVAQAARLGSPQSNKSSLKKKSIELNLSDHEKELSPVQKNINDISPLQTSKSQSKNKSNKVNAHGKELSPAKKFKGMDGSTIPSLSKRPTESKFSDSGSEIFPLIRRSSKSSDSEEEVASPLTLQSPQGSQEKKKSIEVNLCNHRDKALPDTKNSKLPIAEPINPEDVQLSSRLELSETSKSKSKTRSSKMKLSDDRMDSSPIKNKFEVSTASLSSKKPTEPNLSDPRGETSSLIKRSSKSSDSEEEVASPLKLQSLQSSRQKKKSMEVDLCDNRDKALPDTKSSKLPIAEPMMHPEDVQLSLSLDLSEASKSKSKTKSSKMKFTDHIRESLPVTKNFLQENDVLSTLKSPLENKSAVPESDHRSVEESIISEHVAISSPLQTSKSKSKNNSNKFNDYGKGRHSRDEALPVTKNGKSFMAEPLVSEDVELSSPLHLPEASKSQSPIKKNIDVSTAFLSSKKPTEINLNSSRSKKSRYIRGSDSEEESSSVSKSNLEQIRVSVAEHGDLAVPSTSKLSASFLNKKKYAQAECNDDGECSMPPPPRPPPKPRSRKKQRDVNVQHYEDELVLSERESVSEESILTGVRRSGRVRKQHITGMERYMACLKDLRNKRRRKSLLNAIVEVDESQRVINRRVKKSKERKKKTKNDEQIASKTLLIKDFDSCRPILSTNIHMGLPIQCSFEELPGIQLSSYIDNPRASVGTFTIEPGETKPRQQPESSQVTFIVISGTALFRMRHFSYKAKKDEAFKVKKGQTYSITNSSSTAILKLTFIKLNGDFEE